MMGIKEDLLLCFMFFFYRKSALLTDKSVSESGVNIPSELNKQLAEELHKPLENFKKEKFILDLKIIFGVLI